jgi:L-threonylcarbamoyladenylate synthase
MHKNARIFQKIAQWNPYCILKCNKIVLRGKSTRSILKSHEKLIINPTDAGYEFASSLLHSGQLVSFPTETVYGLGANALNDSAVKKIFSAKDRPYSNPLIVHILDSNHAIELTDMKDAELELFNKLGDKFWPGPLTIIVKASNIIPSIITAGTGNIAIRIPSHPIARSLLQASKLPIAAPSANRYGHVSPTLCSHVLTDLGHKNIHVINGEYEFENENEHENVNENEYEYEYGYARDKFSCEFGIESTVIKIDCNNDNDSDDILSRGTVTIHRHGAIAQSQIQEIIDIYNKNKNINSSIHLSKVKQKWDVLSINQYKKHTNSSSNSSSNSALIGEVSPGQSITHYSPTLPCYIYNDNENNKNVEFQFSKQDLTSTVILDFNQKLKKILKNDIKEVLSYKDLSSNGSYKYACKILFDSLRWAEIQKNAKYILLVNPTITTTTTTSESKEKTKMKIKMMGDEFYDDYKGEFGNQNSNSNSSTNTNTYTNFIQGLQDRIYRACSGRFATVNT